MGSYIDPAPTLSPKACQTLGQPWSCEISGEILWLSLGPSHLTSPGVQTHTVPVIFLSQWGLSVQLPPMFCPRICLQDLLSTLKSMAT